jgi:hypothetical protein
VKRSSRLHFSYAQWNIEDQYIDPAVFENEDGKYYMYFGGIWGGQLQKYRNNKYAEENEEPTYGLTKPLDSNSFLWQHFHFMLEMAYAFKYAEGWRNKLKTIFGRPDNINPTYRRVLEQKFVIHKTNKVPSTRFRNYVVIQMVLVLIGLFGFLLIEEQMDLISQISIALIILVSLVNCGALLEQRRWIFYLEYIRFFLTFFIAYYHFKDFFNPYIISAIAFLVTVYFKTLNKQYLRLICGFQ